MFSRRLLTLGALFTVVSGYVYFFGRMHGFIWPLSAGILITMCAYIFQHQLNWWWYQRNPPKLDPEMQKMYLNAGIFYKSLGDEDKAKFNTRARLFVEAKEFMAQGIQDVAEDIKYMVAYYAVMVSFHKQDYLFDPYNRIVIYLHPFLTPHFPDHIHTYELEHEDGTVILSLEQLAAGFLNPSKFYQTGLHAFAELYAIKYLKDQTIPDPDAAWATLQNSGGWSKKHIEDFTGMSQPSPVPVMIHHWFARNTQLNQADPDMYAMIRKWF